MSRPTVGLVHREHVLPVVAEVARLLPVVVAVDSRSGTTCVERREGRISEKEQQEEQHQHAETDVSHTIRGIALQRQEAGVHAGSSLPV